MTELLEIKFSNSKSIFWAEMSPSINNHFHNIANKLQTQFQQLCNQIGNKINKSRQNHLNPQKNHQRKQINKKQNQQHQTTTQQHHKKNITKINNNTHLNKIKWTQD